ncbi:hypothetical protein M422DRAFT_247733 [Sphaerobolus stellatus SS14]|nr:hypothetical protein M422DRAFT_247733 [Sphaerobolus stellatus SS14]
MVEWGGWGMVLGSTTVIPATPAASNSPLNLRNVKWNSHCNVFEVMELLGDVDGGIERLRERFGMHRRLPTTQRFLTVPKTPKNITWNLRCNAFEVIELLKVWDGWNGDGEGWWGGKERETNGSRDPKQSTCLSRDAILPRESFIPTP